MKYASLMPGANDPFIKQDLPKLFHSAKFLDYPKHAVVETDPFFELIDPSRHHPMIRFCTLGGIFEPCNLFEAVPTNVGICAAFNHMPLSRSLKNTKSLSQFSQVYHDSINDNRKIVNVLGSGPKHSLRLVLDANFYTR